MSESLTTIRSHTSWGAIGAGGAEEQRANKCTQVMILTRVSTSSRLIIIRAREMEVHKLADHMIRE